VELAKGVGVEVSRLRLVTDKDVAVALVFTARTPEEFERAHVAMRAAYPELARTYPCNCGSCRAEKERGP
jgi:hypothetical protein